MNRQTIWKTPLRITDYQAVSVPRWSTPLSVHEQGGELCLWWLVDPDMPMSARSVSIYGTGNPSAVTERDDFAGTVVTAGGELVWHVFVNREDS